MVYASAMKNLTLAWISLLIIVILGSGNGILYYLCTADNVSINILSGESDLFSGFLNTLTVTQFLEGQPCPNRDGFPLRTCVERKTCWTLDAYKHLNLTEQYDGCDYSIPYGHHLICCPDYLPKVQTTIPPA